MVSRRATLDIDASRRRIGRSEAIALVAGALACAVGAAAWLTEAGLSATADTADLVSFDDRFVPQMALMSAPGHAQTQPFDRSVLGALEGKLRAAKGVLAQQLEASDWRGSLGEESKPATTSEIPLPRARPATADIQLAAESVPRLDPTPRADNRSVMQKLSDLLPGKMTLASLTPDSGLFERAPDLAALGYDARTAVYDISAHAVYLPKGARLEAHSGMGNLRDDPDHVDQHNIGATPPATYDLRPRERLFHGVRALRMLPVDGSSTLGRSGLLTHSFMLGPDGDSNGCVSIRDYDRFRKAFDDGEISRLVVVPSLGAATAARAASQS